MTISDFKNHPSDKVFDICIIGAGPGGLTLAADLIGQKVSVCLLESGGVDLSREAQDLNSGEITGLPYEALNTCRLRGLGGSTQPLGWGGLCKPLDEEDFHVRPWVSHSGWPFDREHLTPYYVRAQETLGTSDLNVLEQRPRLPVGQFTRIRLDMASVCGNLRVGQHFRQPLDAAKNVFVFLNCTVLYLKTDRENTRVHEAVVRQGGDQVCIKGRTFVLAAGGIENARLMLLSQGIGNQNGLVGRFFMDHPRFTIGTIVPRSREAMKTLFLLDRVRIARRQKVKHALRLDPKGPVVVQGLTLSTEARTSAKLLNHRAWIEPCFLGQDADKLASLRSAFLASQSERVSRGTTRAGSIGERLKIPSPSSGLVWTWLMHMTRPATLARSFRLHHILEPEPDPSSRVVLSEVKDRFGLPKAQLHWHLTEATLESLRRTIAIIGQELHDSDIGKLVVQPEEWETLQRPNWTWHHMGTTRMHDDPRQGVVDANCKVHGTNNLFVVGSSVFPTGGNDLPTLTIVALAHRLADRVKSFQQSELSTAC